MEQEATRPQQKAGGTKRVVDSPGATAGSATPDSAQHKNKLPRDVPGAGKGVGNPRPTIRSLPEPTTDSLTNLPGGGGVNLASAAQAGADALKAADFPQLRRETRPNRKKTIVESGSESDGEDERSDSAASSTQGLNKVTNPTAHNATKSAHRTMQTGEPTHVGVVASVGTEGISIPGIYIPNRPMMELERPPTDHRSWRVAQHMRRCRLILFCTQPQAMNDAALKTAKETYKNGGGAREPTPESALVSSADKTARPDQGSASNKMNQPNQGSKEPKEKIVFVKLSQQDKEKQWEMSQDSVTTGVRTELCALDSDDRIMGCRLLGRYGPYVVGLSATSAGRLLEDGEIDVVHLNGKEGVEVTMKVTEYGDREESTMDEETREKLRAEQREKLEERRHSTKHQKDARTIALMVDMPVELMIATHESPRIMGKAIDTAQQLIRRGLGNMAEEINSHVCKTPLGAEDGTVIFFILLRDREDMKRANWSALKYMTVAPPGMPPAKARMRGAVLNDLKLKKCCFRTTCAEEPCRLRRHAERAAGVRSDQSLFGADERPPPPVWKTEAELRKRAREADAQAERREVQRLMTSPERGKPCTLFQQGSCCRRGRGEQGERVQCNRRHDGWRTYDCASSKDETFVCTWDDAMCPYNGHVARGEG